MKIGARLEELMQDGKYMNCRVMVDGVAGDKRCR